MNILYYREPKGAIGGVDNVAYYLFKTLAKKANMTYFPSWRLQKSYLGDLLNLYRRFTKGEFDIVHFNYCPTWTNGSHVLLRFAGRRRSRTVLNVHGIIQLEHAYDLTQRSIPDMALFNTLNACKLADRIVVNSQYMRDKVITWYNVDRDKIVVIPNGVDMRMFGGSRGKLILNGDPAILYVGTLWRAKGVDVLFQAIAKLRAEFPNVKLHLVGSRYMDDFGLLANWKEIQESVVFHGLVWHSMVPRYYKSADICVFPSRHEGFSIALLEAMAAGTPVIASKIERFREILRDGENAVLFNSEDPDDLSKAIVALCHDLGLRKTISQAALKTAAEYSWENIAERYVSLYSHILRL